jgi:poly(3-hydroxybutyrate) depolymerase
VQRLRTAAWALATVTAGTAALHSSPAAPTDAGQPLRPGTHKVLVDRRVSGIRRSYYVHVHAGDDGTTPLPVVVALHGAFSTARKFERLPLPSVGFPRPRQPVSVLALHGRADTHVPYDGGGAKPGQEQRDLGGALD